MTIELVDGKGGTAHISSEDKAIIHQAKFGKVDMVSDWGDALECTMSSANKATIGTGCASIQGLDWHITSAETVTITNGSQGMKRNDIIAAHYHRDSSSGIEKIELVVLKGAANAMTATDPTVPAGRILSGAPDAYMPLWRIPLDGITVGTPVRLFALRTAVWDSVSHAPTVTGSTVLQPDNTETAQLLSARTIRQFAARCGLDPGLPVSVAAMNGDWDACNAIILGTLYQNGAVLVWLDRPVSKRIRINWTLTFITDNRQS